MDNSIMDNLNGILWAAFGALTVIQLIVRFFFPLFRKSAWGETFDSLWVAMAVALSLKAVLVQPFTIPSGSMEDTLEIGDYILVKKFTYGYSFLNKTNRFLQFNKPKRRDVLVFVYPLDPTKDFIKRCIGLPGDVIELRNGDLYVKASEDPNGQLEKQIEPYVKHLYSPIFAISQEGASSKKVNFGPVTVEAGHYFMMGDNRDDSSDSRYWGQLDEKNIKGQAWVIYYHTLGFPGFLALGSLVVAAFSLVMLGVLRLRKVPPTDTELVKHIETEKKNYFYTLAVCCGLALLMIGRVGWTDFQNNCHHLKDRMFRVIR